MKHTSAVAVCASIVPRYVVQSRMSSYTNLLRLIGFDGLCVFKLKRLF